MPNTAEVLTAAFEHHRRGELAEAAALYRQVLATDPQHAQAWHLLGLTAHQGGNNEEAVTLISRAIVLDGSKAVYHNHLGTALSALQRRDEAEASFRRVLQLAAGDAHVHFQLGTLLQLRGETAEAALHYHRAIELGSPLAETRFNLAQIQRAGGELAEAIQNYRAALAIRPGLPDVLINLAAVLEQTGDTAGAEACWEQLLAAQPAHAEAAFRLGTARHRQGRLPEAETLLRTALQSRPDYAEAHNNLGCVYRDQGLLEAAEPCFRRAVELEPTAPQLLTNLGSVLQKQQDYAGAIACYQRALAANPNFAAAHGNLGSVCCAQKDYVPAIAHFSRSLAIGHDDYMLVSLGAACLFAGRSDEAMEHLQRAVELAPNDARAHCSLGAAQFFRQQVDEALASYARALAIDPNMAEAHYNRAYSLLYRGNWDEGWSEYAWRLKIDNWKTRHTNVPQWDGSPLSGRTLLVHAEQGLGDTLQFIRFAKNAQQAGGAVQIEVQPALLPLLKTSGFTNIVAADEPLPPIDVQIPLMSLPAVYAHSEQDIAACPHYLAADPALIALWQQRLAKTPGRKIGIAWQGNPDVIFDRFRSIPLAAFAPLAAVPGVELISLQKHQGTEQLAAIADRFTVLDLGSTLDGEHGPFMDTAAVIANLDLVITSDTAIAHLAGALGVPVWLALAASPDWRWMPKRADTPWYPQMRLFRQTQLGDWSTVFDAMAAQLRQT